MTEYRLKAFTVSIPAGKSKVMLFNSVSGKKVVLGEALLGRMLKDGVVSSKPEKFVLDNFLVRATAYQEDLELVSRDKISRAIENSDKLSLYVVTTRQCNFRCPYCSMEDNLRTGGGYMKKETLRDIACWVNRRTARYNYGSVEISLYGGEPFYDPQALAVLMEELKAGISAPVSFFAATNGYNLKEANILRLKGLGLRQIMVTLDGPPDVHNKRRVLAGSGEGTFRRILDNVKSVCGGLRTCVRVNIDSQNIGRLDELFSILKAEKLAESVPVDAYPVEPGCSENEHCGSFALSGEALNALADAWEMIHKKGFKMAKRIPFAAPCAYYGKHAFTIDLGGEIYPCPGMIGYKEQICGDASGEALVEKRVPQVWEKCVGCENIFSCAGGCRAVSMAESGGLERRVCRKRSLSAVVGRYYALLQRYDGSFPDAAGGGDNRGGTSGKDPARMVR